jgi:hypothetical protein
MMQYCVITFNFFNQQPDNTLKIHRLNYFFFFPAFFLDGSAPTPLDAAGADDEGPADEASAAAAGAL